jgi:putative membrane protein
MKKQIPLAIKGLLMGAANVIPGVSGGTVALLTGIFEELILVLKSFDLQALRMLCRGKLRAFCAHTRLSFLTAVGSGIAVSILSLARLLEFLFEQHALYVWSFFFGLILASVWFTAQRIRRLEPGTILLFLAGTAVALSTAFLHPAEENASIPYLFCCGMIAMCSMILPGLSGSYVLLLMGNYQLVMIEAIAHFRFDILIPVGLGAVAGLALFARLLAWVFQRWHDRTLALLTGFIFGSLGILWPWKKALTATFEASGRIKEKVIGYTYTWPKAEAATGWALAIMLLGIATILLMERAARTRTPPFHP